MPHPIPSCAQLLVGGVLAKLERMLPDVIIDPGSPDSEQWPNDLEPAEKGPLTHCPEAARAGAAQQVHEERFHLIVGLMREEDGATAPA